MTLSHLPTVTEATLDAFFDAWFSPSTERLFEVDLLAANPDVAREVSHGGYTVAVSKLVFEGAETFAVMADDGSDFGGEAPEAWIKFAETEPEARALANELIMDWKQAWGLVL